MRSRLSFCGISVSSADHALFYKKVVRNLAGDLAEKVELMSEFTAKDGRHSHHYRITYRSDLLFLSF